MLPSNEDIEVPYIGTTIGPICGFKVVEYDGRISPRIVSSYKSSFEWWPKRSSEVAECRPDFDLYDPHNDAPEDKHTCGFYLHYDIDRAVAISRMFYTTHPDRFDFVALVCAWGKVIHHEIGCRSSEMEILALHDDPYKLKVKFKSKLTHLGELMDVPLLARDEIIELAKESGVLIHERK